MLLEHYSKNKKIPLIIFVSFLIVGVFLSLYSSIIFQEGNPWPQIKGIAQLTFGKSDIVKLSDSDNKYITKSKNSAEVIKSYMEKSGYIFTEQMGAGYLFQSSTEEKAIATHKYYSRYYSLWTITKNTVTTFGNEHIEKSIINYLLTQKYFSWKNRDDSFNFCSIENLDPENELFPFYIWAYCAEYVFENNELKTISGHSGPAKINYPNELSFYNLNQFSYEAPGDGADYTKDIKTIFPENLQSKVFNFDRKELINRNEVVAFNNILVWERIKEAINNCEVVEVFQAHSKYVNATLKNTVELEAVEPKLDDIVKLINESATKCGKIRVGIE